MTKAQLLSAAMNLSKDDRIDLAMRIWDTVDPADIELTDEQRKELDRRLAEDDAETSPMEPWSVVRQKLLRGDF
jgi:putative addiction module component (TIGR02574 family)